MTQPRAIEVIGAHVNNLKNIDVTIPLHQFIAVSGLSGSGKSSLAMGVLYAEGARRYLDALATYTRRRISQVGKAKVDEVKHLPAAIALRQRPSVPGNRSTVGTMTECFNVLRLLYSRLGSHVNPETGSRAQPSLRVSEGLKIQGADGKLFSPPGAEDFAFNSTGACPTCGGTGKVRQLAADRLVPNENLTIREGAIASWRLPGRNFMQDVAEQLGINIDTPFKDLSPHDKNFVLHGERKKYPVNLPSKNGRVFHLNAMFENAYAAVEDSMAKAKNERTIKKLNKFYDFTTCPDCGGSRIRPHLLKSLVAGKNIAQVAGMEIKDLPAWADTVTASLPDEMHELAENLVGEFRDSLQPLMDLGLEYLTLDRAGNTLSTGELQRIQLSRTLRSQTTGVLYVLDEPSIGLHPANVAGLVKILRAIVDQGNSLVVVDHNATVISAADQVIEIGPGAGAHGGQILTQGTVEEAKRNPKSLIGPFLTGQAHLIARTQARPSQIFSAGQIGLHITHKFNLHDVHVRFPVNRLSMVTGFSGAGKTSLVLDSLEPALKAQEAGASLPKHADRLQDGGIKRVVEINSVPVGKNVRSTVATYSGILDILRKNFAKTRAAKDRKWTATHFSYNTKQGGCPTCGGTGVLTLDVQYLPDMTQECPTCYGERYNADTLEVKWHGYNIAQILDMSVTEAAEKFKGVKSIGGTLQTLVDMGLGYLHLGESTPALSGGEAQRLKLVTAMGHQQDGTLFIFDEPSVGLHPLDVRTLIKVFDKLLEQKATIIVIEHDLDLIANGDYVVDIGPRGGAAGGKVVATGRPHEIAENPRSLTGKYLKEHFDLFEHRK